MDESLDLQEKYLVESSDSIQESVEDEMNEDVISDNNVEEFVSVISDAACESSFNNGDIAINENNTDAPIDNMVGLVVQEMSETSTSNVSDIGGISIDSSSTEYAQLWVE